ncbi:hypothetical protein F1D59_34765 [Streptomyces sp. INR7]|nr:hypothetical protein F1D59_34765 [Streptomyces sp. INR7]RST16270.1 hypothetical protein EF904_01975 [Streptomyces sp. WAC05950]
MGSPRRRPSRCWRPCSVSCTPGSGTRGRTVPSPRAPRAAASGPNSWTSWPRTG